MKVTTKTLSILFFSAIGGATVALGGAYLTGYTGNKTIIIQEQSAPPVYRTNMSAATSGIPSDFVDAAERSVKAVVHVKTTEERVQQYYDPFNDLFFGQPSIPQRYEVQGSGSGVILSEDGYIVTNNHVVDGAKEITITLENNDEYSAIIVGADPTTDIALLKIEATDLNFIQVANSDQTRLGQWVLAVGNPSI